MTHPPCHSFSRTSSRLSGDPEKFVNQLTTLDSRLRGNDMEGVDSRLRGKDMGGVDSRLRGNERAGVDSRQRGNDKEGEESRLRARITCRVWIPAGVYPSAGHALDSDRAGENGTM